VLPTILFIIGAYALYALVVVWCRWQRSRFLGRRGPDKPQWLTLAWGAVFLGLFLCLISGLAPSTSDQKIRLAGILGVSEGQEGLAKQAALRAASPQVDQKPPGGQPAYALLHPESPPSLTPPAMPLAGSQLRKPKAKQAAVKEPQKPRVEASLTKKDKAPSKVKAKKKKASQPATVNPQGSEDNSS